MDLPLEQLKEHLDAFSITNYYQWQQFHMQQLVGLKFYLFLLQLKIVQYHNFWKKIL